MPTGTVTVEGQSIPILGRFVYHQLHLDTSPEIRGLVHGVGRVDGGTVLYYSVGTPGGDTLEYLGIIVVAALLITALIAGFTKFDLASKVGTALAKITAAIA